MNANQTKVILTRDHGHLEQVTFHEGHRKSNLPTWYFEPDAASWIATLRQRQDVFAACVGRQHAGI